MNQPSFDELVFDPIRAEDVTRYDYPRHISRRDLRRWKRSRWLEEFDTQLAIGGIVAAGIVFFLFVLGVVVSL